MFVKGKTTPKIPINKSSCERFQDCSRVVGSKHPEKLVRTCSHESFDCYFVLWMVFPPFGFISVTITRHASDAKGCNFDTTSRVASADATHVPSVRHACAHPLATQMSCTTPPLRYPIGRCQICPELGWPPTTSINHQGFQ